MDGLTALRNVFARTRNGVAAREESGTGDQKQSDESRHVVLLSQISGGGRRLRAGTRVGAVHLSGPARTLRMSIIVGETSANSGVESTPASQSRLNGSTNDRCTSNGLSKATSDVGYDMWSG
jgi:hypothetical protein